MDFLSSLNISGSGLTAQKLRMDVISQNIANAEVTRTSSGTPYRRKMVVLNSINDTESFRSALDKASGLNAGGVQVQQIVEDTAAFVPVYNPTHPDANEEGYVMLPNVNKAQEMIDMLSTSRAYEANLTAFNATKAMVLKALEIGR
ncbi:flagellar basal body rod protein FlgC [Sinanaerobacter chloroacetimidivorans]|uniref:Flagellar basal-body rod protein FlgC n=1 Tax=Sinanaerobacter chloroacetimidivorans TaxID=2818044 RepID=A0A8J7W1S6_9FIRM|nr:flagellar basal body rod protein FlgC [Sinanaerobacter chloroacetimidivorans]MBR0597526.1 flagellar basal body rod protein FlgC [Sinanaerobacter chloroacetimidivorans]